MYALRVVLCATRKIALRCIVLDNYLGLSISIRAQREKRFLFGRHGLGLWYSVLAGKCLECGATRRAREEMLALCVPRIAWASVLAACIKVFLLKDLCKKRNDTSPSSAFSSVLVPYDFSALCLPIAVWKVFTAQDSGVLA